MDSANLVGEEKCFVSKLVPRVKIKIIAFLAFSFWEGEV